MIRDGASGFAFDLAPPNAVVCVIEPAWQFEASKCQGIDPAPIRAAIAKGQTAQKIALAVANVRHVEGFSYDVMALYQTYGHASSMSAERLDGWIRAASKGVRDQIHRDVSAKSFDGGAPTPKEFDGMNSLAMVIAPDGADAPPIRVVSWSFFADDAIVTVSYVTDAAHLDVVRADAEAIAKTVDWPAAKKAATKSTFAKPREGSGLVSQIAIAFGVVAVIVAFALLFGRRRKKKGA